MSTDETHGPRAGTPPPRESGPVPVSGAGNPTNPGLLRGKSAPTAAARIAGQSAGHRTDVIVVGVDASLSSSDAAEWAGAQAARRHATVRLLHVRAGGGVRTPESTVQLPVSDPHLASETLLQETRAALQVRFPGLGIDTRIVDGDPATALCSESEHARLTVVGARGSGLAAAPFLGSVAAAVSTFNPAPVAVIHPHHKTADRGPVVVGVDGSPASDAAVAFAFEEAALRRSDLLAVHAWTADASSTSYSENVESLDHDDIEQRHHALLSQRLAGWRDRFPDVQVHLYVVCDRSTTALLKFGEGAQLLAVGSRSRGMRGRLLGSTSNALTAHCECPVVVVRPLTYP